MTPFETFKETRKENNKAYRKLKHINVILKNSATHLNGFAQLKTIDSDQLSSKNRVYYSYIHGKYLSRRFRETGCTDLELAHSANDFFDDMVTMAYIYKEKVGQKMHFARAHAKLLLAIHHTLREKRQKYFSKADMIVQKGLDKYGMESNFSYLKNKMQEFKS